MHQPARYIAPYRNATPTNPQVTFLADGSGLLTEALDATVDLTAAHMGKRSQRFAAIVDNGKVLEAHVEESPGDLKVSAAVDILESL